MIKELIDTALLTAVTEVMSYVRTVIRKELEDQGHKLTGALSRDIEVKIKKTEAIIWGSVFMLPYFEYVDRRTEAENIPYSRGSGAGKSKVIEGLERFFRLRGLDAKEALSASFGTVNKWKKEGRPTKNSFRFSKNGRRTGFIEASIERIEKEVQGVFESEADDRVSLAILRALQRAKEDFR